MSALQKFHPFICIKKMDNYHLHSNLTVLEHNAKMQNYCGLSTGSHVSYLIHLVLILFSLSFNIIFTELSAALTIETMYTYYINSMTSIKDQLNFMISIKDKFHIVTTNLNVIVARKVLIGLNRCCARCVHINVIELESYY